MFQSRDMHYRQFVVIIIRDVSCSRGAQDLSFVGQIESPSCRSAHILRKVSNPYIGNRDDRSLSCPIDF